MPRIVAVDALERGDGSIEQARARRLRGVVVYATGYDHVDVPAATRRGIPVVAIQG